ncbi:MAG: hypothetical protein NVS9B5_04790 [Terriglobales bacterium]
MNQRSPTLVGFETIFRRPSFGLAEISWRWTFGFAAILLLSFSLSEYLDSLPVDGADRFLLHTGNPALISKAIIHIFRGSGPRMAEVVLILGASLAIAWIVLASFGRAATVRALVLYFNEIGGVTRSEGESESPLAPGAYSFRSFLGLNFLRISATLAAVVACVGAAFVGANVTPEDSTAIALALQLFPAVVMLILLAWLAVNWFLSLAGVFVIASGENTFAALRAAADLCIDRTGALVAATLCFGGVHFVAAVAASMISMFVLAFTGEIPGLLILSALLAIGLLYFAIVDFLYAGRLAAYVAMVVGPLSSYVSESAPPVFPGDGFDADERILSDLPFAPAEG